MTVKATSNSVEPQPQTAHDFWAVAAQGIAAVSGLLVILVTLFLAQDVALRWGKDPLDSDAYRKLKAELAANPQSEELKSLIRDVDQQLREEYFRQRAFTARGSWLLLGGSALFLLAFRTAATLRRRLPRPPAQSVPQDTEFQTAGMARWAVAALTVVLIGVGLGLYGWVGSPLGSYQQPVMSQLPSDAAKTEAVTSLAPASSVKKAESGIAESGGTSLSGAKGMAGGPITPFVPQGVPPHSPTSIDAGSKSTPLPSSLSGAKGVAGGPITPFVPQGVPPHSPTSIDVGSKSTPLPSTEGVATKEEIAKNWPRFRGPGGAGISAYDNIPTVWNVQKGENILWKTPVPLEGNSSPVVWKDHLFLTGATKDQRQVFCFTTVDGRLLWRKDAPGTPASTAEPPKVNDDTGYASPTPATDGRRIYASFANGDLVAFDFAGALVWARSLGMPKNSYGHAASLATWGKWVIVQFDQATVKENLSKIMALDGETGKTVWETPRAVPNSWCTPILIEVRGQEQLITCGQPWAIAYNPANGKEIWRADCLRRDVGPSPTFADGVVYIANDPPALSALRPDSTGELKPIWSGEDGLPDISCPLATPQYVLLLTSSGTLTSYDAKQGKKLWEQDFDDANFKSSPGMAGKYLYLFADAGKYFVLLPGAEGCKMISQGTMGEGFSASPAFLDGRMVVRGKSTLFCIGKK